MIKNTFSYLVQIKSSITEISLPFLDIFFSFILNTAEIIEAHKTTSTILCNITIALVIGHFVRKQNNNRSNVNAFYKIKAKASLSMEMINYYSNQSQKAIEYLEKKFIYIDENVLHMNENVSHINSTEYDIERVLIEIFNTREKRNQELVKLKDAFNDLIALTKQMNHDKSWYDSQFSPIASFCNSTITSIGSFLKQAKYNDERELKNTIPNFIIINKFDYSQDMPKFKRIRNYFSKKGRPEVWIPKSLYNRIHNKIGTLNKAA